MAPGNTGGDESLSAQFAGLVLQQTNMALMLLGKSPHPETQKTIQDIDGAKMFIDQLEMLEVKTQGNLNADEAKLLKQSLTALRQLVDEHQLEMLEVKTQGNLNADEAKLLKQSLTALRLTFVEAIDSQSPSTAAEQPKKAAAPAEPPESSVAPGRASTPASEEE